MAASHSTSGTLAPFLIRDHILNGSNAIRMPKLIYGTAWKREATPHLVIKAIQNGFRALDTAAQPKHYEESFVGDAVRTLDREGFVKRDQLFIQTKFTPLSGQGPIPPYNPTASLEEQVRQSVDSSLTNFTMDRGEPYLDSLVLHSPLPTLEETLRVWRVLETYHPTQIRVLGISNTTLPILQSLHASATIKPAIVQNRFYPATHFEADLRKWCRERNIVFQSFWTLQANRTMLSRRPVIRLAERVGVERDEAYFALVLGLGGLTILTGSRTPETMRRDLKGVETVAIWAAGEGREEWDTLLDEFRIIVGDVEI
ncbi:hypothetical protein NLU13_6404 [Sarocladium strictum]|uniref:NADP-dependent oxidoreductase domain-containing protein n=1 Tax=Sarocladium strictum TaxID=5046 RepID=A0AA39L7C8_SARSR|nr:hypothetical protein NLU13_6404 [Sarocladium strictum]